jgi:hypothetical protein
MTFSSCWTLAFLGVGVEVGVGVGGVALSMRTGKAGTGGVVEVSCEQGRVHVTGRETKG